MLTLGNKYSYLFTLVIGVVFGIYFTTIFSGCGHAHPALPGVATVPVEVVKRQVAATQAVYQATIDSLATASQQLQTHVQGLQGALAQTRKKSTALQAQVYDLLDRTTRPDADSMAVRVAQDEWPDSVRALLQTENQRDSLCDSVTSNLQTQVSVQDSTLLIQQAAYQALSHSFTRSLQVQDSLQTDNAQLRQSLRQTKRKNIVTTVGLALAAVLGAHLLTR